MIADLESAATAFIDWIATLDSWAVVLVTALSSAIEATFLLGLFIPGESVVTLAGALPRGPGGFALAVAAGTAGAMTSQIAGYAVGRVLGSRLRDTRLGQRIGTERWDRAETFLRDRGAAALVAIRFVAVIHAVVPIVAGTVRMPFGRFVGWSAVGTTVWVTAFAAVGALSSGSGSSDGTGVVLTAVGATCLGIVPFAGRLLRRTSRVVRRTAIA
ncbi:DedA family protein [Actinoplanes sp. NPDC051859]|uniref:DedA family protein n=1 Tax=Actinoplanes sp. NPDC051859 TaxID=3363909 RepID=UPI003797ECD8